MIEVFNRDRSQRLQKGRNLRIVRERVSKVGASQVHIFRTCDGGGQLQINFTDESYTVVNFASYNVLCLTLMNWRNLRGVELWSHGVLVGLIGPNCEVLARCLPAQYVPWYPNAMTY